MSAGLICEGEWCKEFCEFFVFDRRCFWKASKGKSVSRRIVIGALALWKLKIVIENGIKKTMEFSAVFLLKFEWDLFEKDNKKIIYEENKRLKFWI